jgi:hypothetical protein
MSEPRAAYETGRSPAPPVLPPELVAQIAQFVARHASGTVSLNFNDHRIQSVDWRSHERV